MVSAERKKALEAGEVQPKDLNSDDLMFLISHMLNMYIATHQPTKETYGAVILALEFVKADFMNHIIASAIEEQRKYKPKIEIARTLNGVT